MSVKGKTKNLRLGVQVRIGDGQMEETCWTVQTILYYISMGASLGLGLEGLICMQGKISKNYNLLDMITTRKMIPCYT